MAGTRSSRPKIAADLAPTPAERLVAPFQLFGASQSSGGILLLALAGVAMLWANSPWAESYHHLWHELTVSVGVGSAGMSMPWGHWINDLIMALFFLLVGLEIKREVLGGELSSPRKAALPVAAALGGMIVPALIYAGINWGQPTIRGWGVPMATDIAFALGVLALLGTRIPPSLRLFLTTLAIADDLGALLVIALFYTERVDLQSLGIAGLILVALAALGFAGFRSLVLYLVIGAALWYFVFKSGVHATIAGVLLAMTIPIRPRVGAAKFVGFARDAIDEIARVSPGGAQGLSDSGPASPDQQSLVGGIQVAGNAVRSPLHRLESALAPWVGFLIVPLFALANSGVPIGGGTGADTSDAALHVGLGAGLGLLLGKPIGVFLFTWLTVKLGLGALPSGVGWKHIHGVSWLAGIGFTMALFIANLAFKGHEGLLDAAKLGVLGGSVIAAVIGLIALLVASRRSRV